MLIARINLGLSALKSNRTTEIRKMGTRHLIAVIKDGQYKVAQYGQWDGYPSGQGAEILGFIEHPQNVDALRMGLANVRFLDPEGKDKEFIESYEENAPTWSNDPDNRTAAQRHWFELYMSRNLGWHILCNIANSPKSEDGIPIKNSINFAADSLFCEWAYIIDLDNNLFEVYEGFNQKPVTEGRFKSCDYENENGYHPIKLAKSYPFDQLPCEADFVADLEKEEL